MRAFSFLLGMLLPILSCHIASAALVTFEGLLANPNSFHNGGPLANSNGFSLNGAQFPNQFDPIFGWEGWSYSNVVNSTTQDFTNQYAAWPGSGSGSTTYGLAYVFDPTYISFTAPVMVSSADLANTTYAALTMLNGDSFSKKFGGPTGNDPDYLLLTIEGRTGINGGGSTTNSIDFYLSDYRSANNALDFIRTGWTTADLSSLGVVQSLRFSMTTTDVGQFGPNTPLYFAIDNIHFSSIPEPLGAAWVVATGLRFVWIRRRRP